MIRISRAIFLPPVWFRWVFGILSLAAVQCVFLFRISSTSIAYVAFLASALGLYYLITVTIIPLTGNIRRLLMRNRLVRRYFMDSVFKARVMLYRGMMINIFYALFKFITGFYYRSEWLIAIAVYYSVLILLKYSLVYQDLRFLRCKADPDEFTEWRSYRRAGWLMLLMNVGLSGITVQVVEQNRSYSYPGMIIFVMAGYSFYRIVIAVTRLLKGSKANRPIFSAAKVVDVSFAVTGMFTLQTAMFSSFAPDMDVRVPNIITGTAVAVIITVLAAIMIIRAGQKLKLLNNN